MPAKNVNKKFDSPAYYHVYNRGAGEQKVFIDNDDRRKFLSIMARHLDEKNKEFFPQYDIKVISYCLMSSHFHLLLFQPNEPDMMTQFMRSVSTAYSMYFNKRYKRRGHVFQGIYKASLISNQSYLSHISRYIHINPRKYKTYKWSSLPEYLDKRQTKWIYPLYEDNMGIAAYAKFLEDYTDRKQLLDEIKSELAF